MSRYEHAFQNMFAPLEKQIAETDNPRHRAILKNYRLHALLEVSGRYEELLAPTMTVEHPHHRIHEGATSLILDGDDPTDVYLLKRTLAFYWPYDERCRLIGEHVYEDSASRVTTKPDPADIITAARAAELLAPEIEKVLP